MLTPIKAASAKFSVQADSIGVKHIWAFLKNHPPSNLFKHYFIFPTSQGRAFHTLSNNILFLQPVRAEILFGQYFFLPTSQGRAFHTPSNNIFSFSQSGQKSISALTGWRNKILFEGV